jgi:hypothetical protein
MSMMELCMTYRWISLLLGSLLLVAGVRPAAAADPASIELTVQPFFEGNYRAGSWLPFRITVANDGPDLSAVVSVQAGSSFATPLELPRGAEKSVILYARPLDEIRRIATVRVLVSGAELAKAEAAIEGVNTATRVVGHLSRQTLTLALPTTEAATQKIHHIAVKPGDLPDRAEGLSLFDALVIDGAPLDALSPAQQQALADWVRLGGQLVVGGTELEATLSQLPELLRPATIGSAAPRGSISLLPELAEDQSPAAAALNPRPGSRTIATVGTAPVGVQQAIGKGQVTALGFSFSAPELTRITDAAPLWESLLNFRDSPTDIQQMQQVEDAQAQQFASVLTLLPALAVPPLTTLAILLGLYLLIIGPGLYLLLRRLDRQAWGWIAVPLVTIIFSLGAYSYGLQLRGSDTILNQITIVEPIAGRSRVRTYAGIFSPRTQTYQVQASDDALFEPLASGQFGGATVSGGQYFQGSSSIRDLGVPQWSMRTFTAQQMLDVQPLEARLTLEGSTLRGTIRNAGTAAIQDATLIHDLQASKIGNLQPGESRSVELALDGSPAFDRNVGLGGVLLDGKMNSFNRAGQLPTDVRMQQTIVEALFNPLFDAPNGPVVVGWLDGSPLALDVAPAGAQHQQLTIVVAAAEVAFSENGSVSLGNGWFDPSFESLGAAVGGPCLTRSGDGWYIDSGTLTTRMRLPSPMHVSQVNKATLKIERDGPPSELKLSVYDWQTGQWAEQALADTTATLDEPQRYFSSSGLLRARAETSGNSDKGGGCLSINLEVEGSRR